MANAWPPPPDVGCPNGMTQIDLLAFCAAESLDPTSQPGWVSPLANNTPVSLSANCISTTERLSTRKYAPSGRLTPSSHQSTLCVGFGSRSCRQKFFSQAPCLNQP